MVTCYPQPPQISHMDTLLPSPLPSQVCHHVMVAYASTNAAQHAFIFNAQPIILDPTL